MMRADLPLVLLIITMGPAVGSFLGVIADRLPTGRSPLAGASHCDTCKRRLRARDLVPILSAVMLKGRCRFCGAGIPGHLIRIEIAALLVSVAAVAQARDPAAMVVTAAFLWCLVGLFYCDLLHFRLPDLLTAPLFALGMGLAMVDPWRDWRDGLISAAAAAGAFLAIRWGYRALRGREGLGLGDVKLMAGLGAALGWEKVPVLTLVAAVLGLGVVLRDWLRGADRPAADSRVPFGSYLAAAAAMVLLL